MKNTLRLILFTECNLSCHYCCNEQEQFSSQFVKKSFSEIDFSKYKNVCITGGEPFLRKELLYLTLDRIPADKNIFIYSNGLLINPEDVRRLSHCNIKCINIGLHYLNQLSEIIYLEGLLPVRFMIQLEKLGEFYKKYPTRLDVTNTKAWLMDDCEMPNEDWVLLK
jgi:MoaA/NifB/PqqE/SkfB family radical SAM enzyme